MPDPNAATPRTLERWLVPALIIAFCAGAIWLTTHFDRMPPILKRGIQPSDFPQLVCGAIILCTLFMAWRDPVRAEGIIGSPTWGTLVLMVGFVLLTRIDFFLALGVFAAALTVLWGERRIGMIAVVGVVVPVGIFFLFDRGFSIRFPRGLLTNLWYG